MFMCVCECRVLCVSVHVVRFLRVLCFFVSLWFCVCLCMFCVRVLCACVLCAFVCVCVSYVYVCVCASVVLCVSVHVVSFLRVLCFVFGACSIKVFGMCLCSLCVPCVRVCVCVVNLCDLCFCGFV